MYLVMAEVRVLDDDDDDDDLVIWCKAVNEASRWRFL